MLRRLSTVVLLGALVVVGVGCGKNKAVKNPLAQVEFFGSEQFMTETTD